MVENRINLEDFRVKKGNAISKVFTGRDRGEIVREKSMIDELEEKSDKVTIIIPENIRSINPSFFEEMLKNVVKKLGREGFLNKFSFLSNGTYNYQKPLNEAIERILRPDTAIG